MKKYNSKLLLKRIFEICEEKGCTVNVGPEYYDEFLNLDIEQDMKGIIECIIRDKANYINEQILSKKWTKEKEIYEYVMSHLNMMAQGIMCIREEDGKLCIQKPLGDPPDEETEKKITQKIKSTIFLIKRILIENSEKYDKKKMVATIIPIK